MNQAQTWLYFQQMLQAQQQQQMMYQNQFMMYMNFCKMYNLDPSNQYSFNLFYQNNFNPNPQPQPPVSTGNNPVYVSNQLKELIPRSDQTIYINKSEMNLPNKLNIAFKATSGLNIIITVDVNAPLSSIFRQFMDRISLSYNYLGKEIQFLHNGSRLDPFSNEPAYTKFKNNSNVVVYDQGSIIGALF